MGARRVDNHEVSFADYDRCVAHDIPLSAGLDINDVTGYFDHCVYHLVGIHHARWQALHHAAARHRKSVIWWRFR